MKVYISGQMTGIQDFNVPEFNRVAELLRNKGYDVINPADFGVSDEWTWEDYMKKDIMEIMNVDVVATLDNWSISRGASLEVFIASQVGIKVTGYRDLL